MSASRVVSSFKTSVASFYRNPRPRNAAAVAIGASLGLVGLLMLGPGTDGVLAQNTGWGLFGLFGAPQVATLAPAPGRPAAGTTHHLHKRRHVAMHSRPLRLARRSMCVRLCDGYFYPMGNFYNTADKATHEGLCAATFPGNDTRLFVAPGGSDSIADAVAVDNGDRYSGLSSAFLYAKKTSERHSFCRQAPTMSAAISPLRDPTLRRGDVVMTSRGFRIFHGNTGAEHRAADFLSLATTPDLAPEERSKLVAMEAASVTPALRRLALAFPRKAPDRLAAVMGHHRRLRHWAWHMMTRTSSLD